MPSYREVTPMDRVIRRCESRHLDGGPWRRSSACIPANECVEVGRALGVVMVRDSKASAAFLLSFGTEVWDAFLDRLRVG